MAKRKGLVINDRQLDRCDDLLQKLKEVSGSSFLALISTSGQPITTAEDEYHPETLSLASLAASSFAATQQLAKILDENEFTLLFHEGHALNLHVSQVTDQVLLIVTFGRETQVGKVRLYTQRAIEVLRQIFEGPEDETTSSIPNEPEQVSVKTNTTAVISRIRTRFKPSLRSTSVIRTPPNMIAQVSGQCLGRKLPQIDR